MVLSLVALPACAASRTALLVRLDVARRQYPHLSFWPGIAPHGRLMLPASRACYILDTEQSWIHCRPLLACELGLVETAQHGRRDSFASAFWSAERHHHAPTTLSAAWGPCSLHKIAVATQQYDTTARCDTNWARNRRPRWSSAPPARAPRPGRRPRDRASANGGDTIPGARKLGRFAPSRI